MSDDLTVTSRKATYEPAAKTALATGIVAVLLVFPFGVLLGPMAVRSGISARRRIRAADGRLAGSRLALAGIVLGSIGCALSASLVLAEVVTFTLTGGLIPAY